MTLTAQPSCQVELQWNTAKIIIPNHTTKMKQTTETSNDAQDSVDLESLCAQGGDLPVMCLIDLSVQTDFYDEQRQKVEIARYDVTRLTSWAMDIQIEFK